MKCYECQSLIHGYAELLELQTKTVVLCKFCVEKRSEE